jgi:hypothetical protein
VDTIQGLPNGQNRTTGLTASDLSRFQVNLTHANTLTGSFLFNLSDTARSGLSILNPVQTTTNHRQTLFMSAIRDQHYFGHGALLDLGFADSRTLLRDSPQGTQLFEITPFGDLGNYFVGTDRHSYRQQWIANLFLPTLHLLGTHQLKFGIDFEREAFHQHVVRHDYEVLRDDGSVARYVSFEGSPFQARKNFEAAQYIQDHWTPREGLVLEAGLRAEWNEIVRDLELAPRFSVSWAPHGLRDTKFSAGWGVYYDAISMDAITRQQDQVSLSTFFLPGGIVNGPVPTAFQVNEQALEVPYYCTASLTVERKLPREFYAKAGYTRRTGSRGFVFVTPAAELNPALFSGATYQLQNTRRDRYDAVDFSLRRTFAGQFEWFAGYTRSASRTNAVVDYSFPGKLEFLVRNTTAAYLVEYRTGFPLGVVDEDGFMVGPPNSRRFPDYFNLNLHFERKFRALHYLWAWRFGYNNLTGTLNANVVNNVQGTPQFLRYGGGQVRAFSVRLRLVGRK